MTRKLELPPMISTPMEIPSQPAKPQPWGPLQLQPPPPIREFPTELLPHSWRQFAEAVGRKANAGQPLAPMVSLAAVAGAIGGSARVIEAGKPEQLSVWVCGLAPSSGGKSQTWGPIFEPHHEYDREIMSAYPVWAEEHGDLLEALKGDLRKAIDQRIGAGGKDTTVADRATDIDKAKRAISDFQRDFKMPPANVQFVVEDATQEALGEALKANQDKGLILVSPEGGQVWKNFDGAHTRGETSASVALAAYDGERGKFSRIGRGNGAVENPKLSMAIAVQPVGLYSLKNLDQLRDQGLFARMNFVLIEDLMQNDPVPIPQPVQRAWNENIHKLCRLPADEPIIMELDAEAEAFAEDMRRRLVRAGQSGGELDRIEAGAKRGASKARRIAAGFTLYEWAESGRDVSDIPRTIDLDTFQRAATLVEGLLIPCLVDTDLDLWADPDERRLYQLYDAQKKNRHADGNLPTFSLRDIQRKQRIPAKEARRRVQEWMDMNAVRPVDPQPASTGGRPPSPRYEINPEMDGR